MRKPLLGRTTAHAPCICCNERLVGKGVARAREKRQWKRDLYTEYDNPHTTKEPPC